MYKKIRQPGAIISIDMGAYNHIGLVTERFVDGNPTVISLSETHNTVVEQTWDQAVARRRVKLYPEQGNLKPQAVLSRARSYLGRLRWRFLFNCEHFARAMHGLEIKSPELWKAGFKIGAFVGAIWLLKRMKR